MVQEEISFKDISYLELWWPFVQWSRTICAILVEGIMRNDSVNLFGIWASGSGGMVRFKRFLIWSSDGPPVQWSRTIYALLKEGIMGNILVKLYEIWTSGSGGDV